MNVTLNDINPFISSRILTPNQAASALPWSDEVESSQAALVRAVPKTVQHYFGGFKKLFEHVSDPRLPKNCDYPLEAMLFAGFLMFLCRLGARRQIALKLKHPRSVEKFKALFGGKGVPHGDTVNEMFCRTNPMEVQEIVCSMTETLIRKKVLDPYRLNGYFVASIDGTGVWSFANRHCPFCLTKNHNGQVTYYHNVLEAKLVTTNGFAFSLMSEFIENDGKHRSKQDCELAAFYRLARRLKRRFPRLPLFLTLDGLFARGPVLTICEETRWKYAVVLKDGCLRSINEEFKSLLDYQPQNRLVDYADGAEEVVQEFAWVNDASYVDSNNREHVLNVIRCNETRTQKSGTVKKSRFQWITNETINQENVAEIANNGGRISSTRPSTSPQ